MHSYWVHIPTADKGGACGASGWRTATWTLQSSGLLMLHLGGGSSARSPLSSPWTVQAQCARGVPCPDDTAYRGCSALRSSIHILDNNISGLEIRGTCHNFHLPLLDQLVQSVPKCFADFLARVIHPPMVLCTYLFFSLPVLLHTSVTYLFY